MSAPLLLGALTLPVLLVWAWFLIRAMAGVTARARTGSGRTLPGPGATWPHLRHWMTSTAHAGERKRLALLSILLVALQAVTLASVI